MTAAKPAYPLDCHPARVVIELARLMVEFLARPLPGSDWAELVAHARWSVDWQGRKGRQWVRLERWARATDQPEAVCRAILSAEHYCSTRALEAEARAVRHEREAAKHADRTPAGAR